MQNTKKYPNLSTKLIEYSLLVLTAGFFICSLPFAARSDNYNDLNLLYYNYLIADLLRYLSFFSFLILVWIKGIKLLKVKVAETKYFTILYIFIATISIVYLTMSTISDLTAKPTKTIGTIVKKEEKHFRAQIEYHIQLSTSGADFKMAGDNSKNGWLAVQQGDKVELLFGESTKQVFLIKKVNSLKR